MKWYVKKNPYNRTIHKSADGRWAIIPSRKDQFGRRNFVLRDKQDWGVFDDFDTIGEAKLAAEGRTK